MTIFPDLTIKIKVIVEKQFFSLTTNPHLKKNPTGCFNE